MCELMHILLGVLMVTDRVNDLYLQGNANPHGCYFLGNRKLKSIVWSGNILSFKRRYSAKENITGLGICRVINGQRSRILNTICRYKGSLHYGAPSVLLSWSRSLMAISCAMTIRP